MNVLECYSFLLNTSKNKPSVRPVPSIPEDFETLRSKTLHQLQDAVINFQSIKTEDLAMQKVIFDRGGKRSEFRIFRDVDPAIMTLFTKREQFVPE